MTKVDLRALVEAVLRDRQLTITERHIEVVVDVPSGITVRAWERGLVQVVANLVDNAIKYTRDARPPRLRIAATAREDECRLIFSDNGIGFDMKYHDRIFGLFNRLVRAEDYEGTGAGLAIVRKVLEKQGGRVWAESAPGAGATFYVALPGSGISVGSE
jgi:light-regulated signal transduction histidine kinase (bacteriophytochrome)